MGRAQVAGIPIFFVHAPFHYCLGYSLSQALAVNPTSPVYLIGDRIPWALRPFLRRVRFVDRSEYGRSAEEFRKIYKHVSVNPYEFELASFQRWFVLEEFTRARGIDRFFYADSDVMIYTDLTREADRLRDYDLTVSKYGGSDHVSIHASFWTRKILQEFTKYLEDLYARDGFHVETFVDGNPHFSDMYAMEGFLSGGPYRIANTCVATEGSLYDHNVNFDYEPYRFEKKGSARAITWVSGCPYTRDLRSGQFVRFSVIHFQGNAKNWMKRNSSVGSTILASVVHELFSRIVHRIRKKGAPQVASWRPDFANLRTGRMGHTTGKEAIKSVLSRLGLLKWARLLLRIGGREERLLFRRVRLHGEKLGFTVRRKGLLWHPRISIQRNGDLLLFSWRHLVYGPDVLENFQWYHSAVEPVKKNGRSIVDYSRPRLHTLPRYDVAFYFSSFAEGIDTVRTYLENAPLKEGDVVLDLGAYCGAATWGFSRAVGAHGRVYAIEPDPGNYRWLKKNIARHSLENVIPINAGIWSVTGRLMFQKEGNMGSGFVDVLGRDTKRVRVNVLSLEDLCREFGVAHVELVKMDIEGSEIEVLRAAGRFLDQFQPRLVIEPHYLGGKPCTETVVDLLADAGYDSKVIDQAGYVLPLVVASPRRYCYR